MDTLRETLNQILKQAERKKDVYEVCQSVVGSGAGPHIKNITLKNKRLIFFVDSAIWAAELRMWRKELKDKVQEATGEAIKGITIAIGG